jgi:hypothetical protein
VAHGGFGYGSRNQEGEDVLDFAMAFDLMIANTFFRKRESLIWLPIGADIPLVRSTLFLQEGGINVLVWIVR